MDSPAPRPPRDWVIYALIAANLIVFGIELAAGADPMAPGAQKMIDMGGNFGPLTLHGQWWRMVSAVFLHYGLIHVGLNMLCLWQGRVAERVFGHAGLASIYVVAGLAGGIASLVHSADRVTAGASGAVFGVFGAFGAFLLVRRAEIRPDVWAKTARGMATFIGINLVYGLSTPSIDMSAHLGGLGAGFAVGALLLLGHPGARARVKRAIGLAIAGVAITAGALYAIPAPDDVSATLVDFAKVEDLSIDAFNAIIARAKTEAITDAQAADQIERDVLVPWRSLRARVFAIEHPPARLAPLFDRLRTYVTSRQEAWETFVIAARASAADQPAKIAEYQRKDDAATADGAAVKAEIDKLGAAK